jgi:hypothetical protein
MNDWINTLAEALGIGRMGLDFSLSDLSLLAPDAKVVWIVAAAAAFCVVAGCQEVWSNHRHDRKSDGDRKQK